MGKIGYVLGNQGKWAYAIEAYDQALQIDPKHAKVLYNKGIALNGLGRYEEAIQAFDQQLKINPKSGPAKTARSFAVNKLKKNNLSPSLS